MMFKLLITLKCFDEHASVLVYESFYKDKSLLENYGSSREIFDLIYRTAVEMGYAREYPDKDGIMLTLTIAGDQYLNDDFVMNRIKGKLQDWIVDLYSSIAKA